MGSRVRSSSERLDDEIYDEGRRHVGMQKTAAGRVARERMCMVSVSRNRHAMEMRSVIGRGEVVNVSAVGRCRNVRSDAALEWEEATACACLRIVLHRNGMRVSASPVIVGRACMVMRAIGRCGE